MIVVSDTSPITALLVIEQADLLPALFDTIVVPSAVLEELLRFHFPLPSWIEARPVADRSQVIRFQAKLHLGEAEAIALAIELAADHLLIDERKGRRVARKEGLPVIGLMGVLAQRRRRNCSHQSAVSLIDWKAIASFTYRGACAI